MKTEVKYLGNTKGELFTSWHYVPSSPVSPPHADIGKWPFNSSRIAETVTNDPQQHQIKSRVTKGTALSLQQPHLPWETERRKIPMHPGTDINFHRTD